MGVKKFYGWKQIGALWAQYLFNMGLPLYGGTVIISIMLAEGAISKDVHGWMFTILNLCIGLSSVLVARSVQKYGVCSTFSIGILLIMTGSLYMGLFTGQGWCYLIAYGIVVGTGIGFGSVIPLSTSAARWFVKKRGTAMAAALTAPSIAGLIFSPFMNWLVTEKGISWKSAWLCVAAIMMIAMVINVLFVKESPEKLGQFPDGEMPKKDMAGIGMQIKSTWTPEQARKTGQFWIIVIVACAVQYPFFFFTAHWIPAVKLAGFSAMSAAVSMSVFTIMGLPARLVAGYLLDRIPVKYVFAGGFFCYIISNMLSVTVMGNSIFLSNCASAFAAFGFGTTFVSMQTVTVQFFGTQAYSKLNGDILLLSAVISCPAPIAAGIILGRTQSYQLAFLVNLAVVCIGLMAVLFLRKPQSKEG